MPPAYWLPPVLWMGLIAWFSSGFWSAEHTGDVLLPLFSWLVPGATHAQVLVMHALARKLAHVTEYAILGALWFRAFTHGAAWHARKSALAALAICVAWASLDELHQAFVPARTPSVWDVALDGSGAAAALGAALLDWRRRADVAVGLLLWIAAAGGATLLALNAMAGVSSGALWLTAPAAAAVLVARRVWGRPG